MQHEKTIVCSRISIGGLGIFLCGVPISLDIYLSAVGVLDDAAQRSKMPPRVDSSFSSPGCWYPSLRWYLRRLRPCPRTPTRLPLDESQQICNIRRNYPDVLRASNYSYVPHPGGQHRGEDLLSPSSAVATGASEGTIVPLIGLSYGQQAGAGQGYPLLEAYDNYIHRA